jgi:hypothetical protein
MWSRFSPRAFALNEEPQVPVHEEGVVDGVVTLLELVLAADLVEVFHVPPESTQDRLDQGVLGVLLADRLPLVLRDPVAHVGQGCREVVHESQHLPCGV